MHAPVNGSEATNGKPDENFTFTVGKVGEAAQPVASFFGIEESKLEKWNVSRRQALYGWTRSCFSHSSPGSKTLQEMRKSPVL